MVQSLPAWKISLMTAELGKVSCIWMPNPRWAVGEHCHMRGSSGHSKPLGGLTSLPQCCIHPCISCQAQYHRLGGLNNRNLFSHSSGGRIPRSKCQEDRFLLKGVREEFVPCLCPSFRWFVDNLAFFGLLNHHPNLCLTFIGDILPMYLSVSKFSNHFGLGDNPLQYDLILTNYICNNPISK